MRLECSFIYPKYIVQNFRKDSVVLKYPLKIVLTDFRFQDSIYQILQLTQKKYLCLSGNMKNEIKQPFRFQFRYGIEFCMCLAPFLFHTIFLLRQLTQ